MKTIKTKAQAPIELRFDSGETFCAATYYCPSSHHEKLPIIVMAHGLGGVKAMRLPAFAERFVAEGYACLLFDYRYFGESGGEPRQLLDISCQLDDWKAAIDFVKTRSEIDPNKIILWGTSFGGGHVLATAAGRSDIAAVISQCPFTDGMASSLVMNPATSFKVSWLALCDLMSSWRGSAPVMVPLSGLPGETALMNTADAYRGYLQLLPQGVDVPNFVAARFALNIIRYYPGRKTRLIQSPVLFCVCENDTVAPTKATLRHANRTPHKEIRIYADGHFDIYVGEAFEKVIHDQIDFLRRTVPVHSL